MGIKSMTGLQRTLSFIKGQKVDRPPFHPIIMRWAAKYAGVKYREFCTDPVSKSHAMIQCAVDFDIDWVTVMSDPWAEASAFGIEVNYPEDSLPVDIGGHFPDAKTASLILKYNPLENERCMGRIKEIEEYRKELNNEYFIVGWIEGPVAEYVDLRGATGSSLDFLLEGDHVEKAMDVIVASAIDFISLQIDTGAHCIGIGDAFCSQIGPDLYNRFAFDRQKFLVDHIHKSGALAKLHICGNTEAILPGMIATGADIIDIDHLVPSMKNFASLLGPKQVFSGKADPVTVIQMGSAEKIMQEVQTDFVDSGGRCIISAGCEITPGTSIENMESFSLASKKAIQNRKF
jgi:MtaA/CmuA family methyltransferase